MKILVSVGLALIAYFQFSINHQRFVLELFDKRMNVFENIRIYLIKVVNGIPSHEDDEKFLNVMVGCKFLFDQETHELAEKIWRTKNNLLEWSSEDPSVHAVERREARQWAYSELAGLQNKFDSFLVVGRWFPSFVYRLAPKVKGFRS